MGKNKELGHMAIAIYVKIDKIGGCDKINSSRQFFWIQPLTFIGKVGKMAIMAKGAKN